MRTVRVRAFLGFLVAVPVAALLAGCTGSSDAGGTVGATTVTSTATASVPDGVSSPVQSQVTVPPVGPASPASESASGGSSPSDGDSAGATAGLAPSGAAVSGATPTSAPQSSAAISSAPISSAPISSAPTSSKPALPTPTISSSPAFGAQDLAPAQQISIAVRAGTIASLQFKNPAGKVVKGELSADKTSWTLGEVLGFGKTYTAEGMAVSPDGQKVPISGTYRTVGQDTEARVTITPGDGAVVGVASPIIIGFPIEPEDRALIEKALTVTTTPKVEGSWAWIHHNEGWGVDWRPRNYWPANTKVHVEAKIYGLRLATGAYASTDLSADFSIGRSQVVYADAKSFNIVVKQGCTQVGDPNSCAKTVATYPGSYGSGDDINDPNRVTRSGVHVVSEKLPVHKMSNPKYGYVDVTEYWDVRISTNGEFIHQNQKTVGDQGVDNVSHGCINLSAANAKAYFNSAILGDPVEVTGTSVALSPKDGDVFDWTIPWSEWQGLSAL